MDRDAEMSSRLSACGVVSMRRVYTGLEVMYDLLIHIESLAWRAGSDWVVLLSGVYPS